MRRVRKMLDEARPSSGGSSRFRSRLNSSAGHRTITCVRAHCPHFLIPFPLSFCKPAALIFAQFARRKPATSFAPTTCGFRLFAFCRQNPVFPFSRAKLPPRPTQRVALFTSPARRYPAFPRPLSAFRFPLLQSRSATRGSNYAKTQLFRARQAESRSQHLTSYPVRLYALRFALCEAPSPRA